MKQNVLHSHCFWKLQLREFIFECGANKLSHIANKLNRNLSTTIRILDRASHGNDYLLVTPRMEACENSKQQYNFIYGYVF